MRTNAERYLWGAAFVLIVVLAVPWFLWRDGSVAYGLPVWLWWHVGWMFVTAATFWLFSRRAWGLWVEGERT